MTEEKNSNILTDFNDNEPETIEPEEPVEPEEPEEPELPEEPEEPEVPEEPTGRIIKEGDEKESKDES